MNRRLLNAVLVCGALVSGDSVRALPAQTAAPGASARFRALAADYFEQVYFRFAPTQGTQAGLHQYDPQIEDFSRAGIDIQISALKAWETKFDGLSDTGMDQGTHGDLMMVRNNIRGD